MVVSAMTVLACPGTGHSMPPLWIHDRHSVSVEFFPETPKLVQFLPGLDKLNLPAYPMEFVRAGVGGKVEMDLGVNSRGEVVSSRLVHSDYPELGKEAAIAAQKWCTAGTGESLMFHVRCIIIFRIEEE